MCYLGATEGCPPLEVATAPGPFTAQADPGRGKHQCLKPEHMRLRWLLASLSDRDPGALSLKEGASQEGEGLDTPPPPPASSEALAGGKA